MTNVTSIDALLFVEHC